MELKDYLQKSKERRENIMKTANKYLNKTSSGEIIYKTKKPGLIDDNAFYGPTPKGLKSFEEEVNQQLKKYFKPEAPDTGKSQNKIFRNIGVNKGIQKAYSKTQE
jgi:hypothetical protein